MALWLMLHYLKMIVYSILRNVQNAKDRSKCKGLKLLHKELDL